MNRYVKIGGTLFSVIIMFLFVDTATDMPFITTIILPSVFLFLFLLLGTILRYFVIKDKLKTEHYLFLIFLTSIIILIVYAIIQAFILYIWYKEMS